jgi:hypothetical protein
MTAGWPDWLQYAPPLVLLGLLVWFVASRDPLAPRRPQTRGQHVRQFLFWSLMTATWAVLLAYKWREPDANQMMIALYLVAVGAGALEALRWLIKAHRIPAPQANGPSSIPPRA